MKKIKLFLCVVFVMVSLFRISFRVLVVACISLRAKNILHSSRRGDTKK